MTSQSVALWQSRRVADFEPLFEELAPLLGNRFPDSMRNWCGIGERPYPLEFWQVYLIFVQNRTAGVVGLYKQYEAEPGVCWVGWFGLLSQFRGKSIGVEVLTQLQDLAREFGYARLCAYTDSDNTSAIRSYQQAGFVPVGTVDNPGTGRSADPNGLVLCVSLRSDRVADGSAGRGT